MPTIPQWMLNLLWFNAEKNNPAIFNDQVDYAEVKKEFCLLLLNDFKDTLSAAINAQVLMLMDFTINCLEINATPEDFSQIKEQAETLDMYLPTNSIPRAICAAYDNDPMGDMLLGRLPDLMAEFWATTTQKQRRGSLNFLSTDNSEEAIAEQKELKRQKIYEYRQKLLNFVKTIHLT